jgi:hypothetical protein
MGYRSSSSQPDTRRQARAASSISIRRKRTEQSLRSAVLESPVERHDLDE